VGLFATSLASVQAGKVDASYWARTQVRFMEPLTPDVPNGLESNTYSLIATAGVVQAKLAQQRSTLIVSPETLLVDTGVRHGYSIILPNSGGQWTSYFASPWLDVQVVGSSPQEVTQRMQLLQRQIVAQLDSLQDEAGVSAPNRIRTQVNPPGPPQVFVEHGAQTRALAGTLLLGALLTAMLVALARRVASTADVGTDPSPAAATRAGAPASAVLQPEVVHR
jgi:hypothetical protein